jgi:hypothetical protein
MDLYLHSPNTPPWRGSKLKHRDNFTFIFVTAVKVQDQVCWVRMDAARSSEKLVPYCNITQSRNSEDLNLISGKTDF